jgi:hypothetical protein
MSSSSSQSDTIAGVNLPDLSARSLSYLMVGVLTDTLTSKPGRAADLTSLAAEAARRKAGLHPGANCNNSKSILSGRVH